jgi:hypothetical protein
MASFAGQYSAENGPVTLGFWRIVWNETSEISIQIQQQTLPVNRS